MSDDNTRAALLRAIEAIEKKTIGLAQSGSSVAPQVNSPQQEPAGSSSSNLVGDPETASEQPTNQKRSKRIPGQVSAGPQAKTIAAGLSADGSSAGDPDAVQQALRPKKLSSKDRTDAALNWVVSERLFPENANDDGSEAVRDEASDRALLRRAALNLLAQREQTAAELQQKLGRRFPDQAWLLDAVIQRLQDQGLQNDTRMAEAYVRYRVQRGQGPMKIRREMGQKGLAANIIDEAFQTQAPDWIELAASVLYKRFGALESPKTLDRNERAKRSRFLQQRGFHYEHISAAL